MVKVCDACIVFDGSGMLLGSVANCLPGFVCSLGDIPVFACVDQWV